MRDFDHRLFSGLLEDGHAFQRWNTDYARLGLGRRARFARWIENLVLALAGSAGFTRRHFKVRKASRRLVFLAQNLDRLRSFHDSLADEWSKSMLIEVLKLRVLGPAHVRLPCNTDEYWRSYHAIERTYPPAKGATFMTSQGWRLRGRVVRGSTTLTVCGVNANLLNTFAREQYAYRHGDVVVSVEPGDCVIDGGACWGDSSLYFIDRAHPNGRVFAFEFEPENVEILQRTLSLNKHVNERIKLETRALWDVSGEVIAYRPGRGPATSLLSGEGDQSVKTVTLDEYVESICLSRVDFIKLDVEGAELRVLRGAEGTLRRFKPKLAIALYHRDEDFVEVPEYLKSLDLGYSLFLDHYTIHLEETVLFALPSSRLRSEIDS